MKVTKEQAYDILTCVIQSMAFNLISEFEGSIDLKEALNIGTEMVIEEFMDFKPYPIEIGEVTLMKHLVNQFGFEKIKEIINEINDNF